MAMGFMSITMTEEVHQNLHETLHHEKKFEKSALNANAPGQRIVGVSNAENRR